MSPRFSRCVAFLIAGFVLAPMALAQVPSNEVVRKLSPDDFDKARKEKDAVVIDVRSPEEFAAGRIPGALNIPVTGKGAEDFEKKVAEAARGKTPLLYCRSGNRSGKAAVKMQAMGFKSIIEMPGGWVAWTKTGKDVEKGPATVPTK